MKPNTFIPMLFSTLIFPLSAQAESEQFSGHRIGAGLANTVEVYNGSTYHGDSGLHLEYGYDFNRIVGLQVDRNVSGSNLGYGFNVDTVTWKVGADIGYAFNFSRWDLKPYGATCILALIPVRVINIRALKSNSTIGFQVDSPYDTDIGQASLTVGYKF